MTTKPRRMARRLLEVFDWRTFAVAGAFLTALLIGYAFYSAFAAAHDATEAANLRGKAATRRIDLLNAQIQQLQAEIAAGRDDRGQLAATVNALAEQVRQMGGRPVLTAPTSTTTIIIRPSPGRSASPSPTRTGTPHPRPSPTRTATPSPSPSPSCTRLLVLPC